MASINTNYGALVALQSLNATTKQLQDVQNQVNTGLKVSSAKDNGAVFAIAEGQRARVSSLGAISDGIDRASSTIDTALSAGQAIGDILKQLKEQAVAAEATDLNQSQRDALQANFAALRDQVDQIANAATFNGSNLVNGTNLSGGSNALNVQTSDVTGSPNTLTAAALQAGATTATTLTAASQATLTAGDTLTFSLTNGSNTTSYTVTIGTPGTETVQDFLDSVYTSTNGEVSATFDPTTRQITYSSSKAFTAKYDVAAGTGFDDKGQYDGTTGTGGTALSGGSSTATSTLAVSGYDFRLGKAGQALSGITSLLDISSSGGATSASTAIDAAITALNTNLATLGAQSKALDTQKTFLGQLSDTITAGIGNLVDADLAKESAQLQALQVKQQLGAQALSIANQAPSIVLSFFK
ncbi:MAG: flagellin [Alphaproteobacteria bacterium]